MQCIIDGRADIVPYLKQLRLWSSARPIVAFRWNNGKVVGIYDNGEEREFLHVHLQKRAMMFAKGLEKENRFLIFPEEFTPDHELTPEEITSSITPSPEYELKWNRKYRVVGRFPRIMRRAEDFLHDNLSGKIAMLKRLYDTIIHRHWLSFDPKQEG